MMNIYKVTTQHSMMIEETRQTKYFTTEKAAKNHAEKVMKKYTQEWQGKTLCWGTYKIETIKVED